MHNIEQIPSLMRHRPGDRDLAWLEQALQSAVSVEFSTIPPYLCALWSIKDELHPVAKSIRNVVHEEMLHMSLACNMLTAIGRVPQINNPKTLPQYPGKIPGMVRPDLTVTLSGLSDAALDVFIAIEAPSFGEPTDSSETGGYKTIGSFYESIRTAFRRLSPKISTERQVTGPLAFMVMENLDHVEKAISFILDQGEGSEASPVVGGTRELAHYYRFLEVKHRQRYGGIDQNGRARFDGEPLKFPAVWPMAVVPKGGYLRPDVPADVWNLIEGCDRAFTEMLVRLQSIWENGGQGSLVRAIESMFALSQASRALMRKEIGQGPGTYGPCFRLI